jgi:spore maturation protein A
MLGKCFGVLCVLSVAFAVFTGNVSSLSEAVATGATKSVSLVISLVGIMAFWNGLLNVFKDAGIIEKLSRLLKPILKRIFPSAFKENVATEEITACISANMLGIANASTPLAIAAMKKLSERDKSGVASADMIMLAMLGCCSFNLIPTTIIAIRASHNASITYELIPSIWLCSGICSIIGVILCLILGKINAKN